MTTFPFEHEADPHDLAFEGTVNDAVQSIADGKESRWMAARVIRAAMDLPFSSDGRLETIALATEFALRVMQDAANIDHTVTATLQQTLGQIAIVQRHDLITLESSTPAHSKATADRINERIPDPVLILALGHGGTVSALQTYLYLQAMGRPKDAIYPIRFSVYKDYGYREYVSPDERQHLQALAEGRQILVVDEDAIEGITMDIAVPFFAKLFGRQVMGIVNSDRRRPEYIAEQGLWWENCQQ